MIMTEYEMDEQLDMIENDFWEEQERAEDEYDARQAEIEEAYNQGRADEQLQSIEDAKMQATEYLDALDKAKKEAYQQGAKSFAEWLVRKNGYLDLFGNDTNKLLAEWQKGEEE